MLNKQQSKNNPLAIIGRFVLLKLANTGVITVAKKFKAPKSDQTERPTIDDIIGRVVYVGIYIDPAGGVGKPINLRPKTTEGKES